MLSAWHDEQRRKREGDGMEPTVGIAEAMVATAAALAPARVASADTQMHDEYKRELRKNQR